MIQRVDRPARRTAHKRRRNKERSANYSERTVHKSRSLIILVSIITSSWRCDVHARTLFLFPVWADLRIAHTDTHIEIIYSIYILIGSHRDVGRRKCSSYSLVRPFSYPFFHQITLFVFRFPSLFVKTPFFISRPPSRVVLAMFFSLSPLYLNFLLLFFPLLRARLFTTVS